MVFEPLGKKVPNAKPIAYVLATSYRTLPFSPLPSPTLPCSADSLLPTQKLLHMAFVRLHAGLTVRIDADQSTLHNRGQH